MVKMLGCIKFFMVGYRNGVRFDRYYSLMQHTNHEKSNTLTRFHFAFLSAQNQSG